MTTSGTTAFSLTARDFVTDALRENGIIGVSRTCTDSELTACLRRLNLMLKTWQLKGALWKQEVYSASGTANTATISLPVYVRQVNGARYYDSATNERQMARWERDEYMSLPNKAASGTPTIYYVRNDTAELVLNVWPVPTASFTIKLDIDRAMDTVTDADETLDLPEELSEAVMANLAVRCCGIFQKEPSAELVMRARELETLMLDTYRPASYVMEAG